jgi:hypothetical protein
MVAPAANWLPPGLGHAEGLTAAPADGLERAEEGTADPAFWQEPPPWRQHEELSSTAAAFICIVVATSVLAVAALIAGGSGSPDFTLGLAIGVGAGVVPYVLYLILRAGWWAGTGDRSGRRRRLTEDEWRRIFGPRQGSRFSGTPFFGSASRADQTSWQSAQFVDPDPQEAALHAFAVLGVGAQASIRDVRIAYHRLAHRYHPDKVAGESRELRERAEQRMKELNAAYAVIQQRARAAPVD